MMPQDERYTHGSTAPPAGRIRAFMGMPIHENINELGVVGRVDWRNVLDHNWCERYQRFNYYLEDYNFGQFL